MHAAIGRSERLEVVDLASAERIIKMMRVVGALGLAARANRRRALVPATPVTSALPLLARDCLGRLARHQRRTLAGKADAVHEMRIALRQLRVLLRTFEATIGASRSRVLRAESKWVSDELGLVRDLDVFLEALDRDGHRGNGARAERRRLARVRRQLHGRLVTALRSPRYLRFLADTRDAISGAPPKAGTPKSLALDANRIDTFAASVLERRRRKFVRAARRIARLDVAQRHELRIRGRKLRYAMEFFGNAYPGDKRRTRLRRAIGALRRLQVSLGALNDRVQQRTLRDRYVPQGVAALFNDAAAPAPGSGTQPQRLLRAALAAIEKFERIKPFWD